MNLSKTIKNIRATCNNYVDPNLLAFIIDDDDYMGTNNILEIEGYGIGNEDTYEERLIKIHNDENIFLPLGMMTFMPILNECDLFSSEEELAKSPVAKEFGINTNMYSKTMEIDGLKVEVKSSPYAKDVHFSFSKE